MPERHPLGRRCSDLLPLALLLMPYALARYGIDTWRQRRCGGVFTADPAVPPDPLTGQQTCVCRLPGMPGDPHHPATEGGTEDVRTLQAGEKGDGE